MALSLKTLTKNPRDVGGSNATHPKHESSDHLEALGEDDAAPYLASTIGLTWTSEEEKKVVRKIDFCLLPILFFINLFCLFDSQAFGISALFGSVVDLKMYSISSSGLDLNKFSWASSIIYFGGLISLYPIMFLAQKFALGKITAGIMVWSGVFTLLMLTVENFEQTMVVRFFYGFQSANVALSVIVTSTWYKKEEQPLRVGIWNTGQAFGSMIGQAIDYGAVSITIGPFTGHVWKYMYLVFGLCATVTGLFAVCVMANNPMTAFWLKGRDRDIAVARLASNGTGIHNSRIRLVHIKSVFYDPQIYAFAIASFGISFCNAAISTFGALLAQSIPGVSAKEALLLLMPASAVAIFVILLSGALASFFPKRRLLIGMLFILPNLVGNVLLWKTNRNSKNALLAGLYTSVFFYGFYVQYAGLLASNIGGSTKRSAANAFLTFVTNVGSIAGPFSFKGNQASEGYPTGIISLLSLSIAMCASFIFLMIYYHKENSAKQSALVNDAPAMSEQEFAFSDCTEKENPYFRYNI